MVSGICSGLQAGDAMHVSAQSIQQGGGGGSPGSLVQGEMDSSEASDPNYDERRNDEHRRTQVVKMI